MRPLIAIALTLTVLGAAACSGDDEADPTTTTLGTTTPSTPPVVEPTEPDATTTVAPTTTSTTAAPTTTTDPTEALIAEIEADLNAGEAALIAAGADPSNPDLRAELERHFTEDGLLRVTEYLDELAADGLRARASTSVANVVVVRDATPSPVEGESNVVICRVDATVVYEPIGDTEAIVNDLVVRTVSAVGLSQDAGIWRVRGGGEQLERTEGATTCE